ncbi:MAG TPA: hypothetical protein VK848_13300 [Acidimicrobiia bacterium]|nr:hypothetical protein [Acidimicrobiia bacterium]
MFKPSSRALGVATALTLSAVILAPSASAALLGSGGNSGALPLPALSGVTDVLPLSGNLAKPVQDLLGPGVGVGGLGGTDGSGGELVDGVFEAVGGTTLACDAAAPQLLQAFAGDVAGSLCEFNPFDGGVLGLLSSL